MTGVVTGVWRYPVKSMLGERLASAQVGPHGVAGDRVRALLDRRTGSVVSAKDPRRWRAMLTVRAAGGAPGPVRVVFPDGEELPVGGPGLDERLSGLLDAPVTMIDVPPPGAHVHRARPEAVLAAGVAATVPVVQSPLGSAAPGTFFDFAPIHLVTSATLARLADEGADGVADVPRYRPNLVLDVGADAFVENGWVGRDLHVGSALVLRVVAPTPRCAVPTLAHGALPPRPEALRGPARLNRIAPLPQLDPQPCVGAYAQVVRPGRVEVGAPVEVSGAPR